MRPIAIFQFSPNVEPGYFASFLEARNLPFTLFRIDEGTPVPTAPTGFSGICLMGGVMSVNDPLPWIPQILELIRQAVAADIPVIGHCLGGQLLSRALGGVVTRNRVAEIGWGKLSVTDSAVQLGWLDSTEGFPAFHWHHDTFSLPEKAIPLMSSAHCQNQAFALGPHLGMQCHVEMTEALIRTWNKEWAEETASAETLQPSVQPSARQLAELGENLPHMRAMAHRLYERWLENVRKA
jgi:GMP synthase-like glutamine amidotransferase